MTRSMTKQSVDTLQQMVADILNKFQVEKDEGPEAEELLRLLIVVEGPN